VRVVARVRELGVVASLAAVAIIVVLCMAGSYGLGLLWASFESAPVMEPPSPIAAKRLGALADPVPATAPVALPRLRGANPKPPRKLGAPVGKSPGAPVVKEGSSGEGGTGVGSGAKAPGSTQIGTQTDSSPTETQPKSPPTETQTSQTETAPTRTSAKRAPAK
jgi:hypothetical protein